MSQAKKKAVGKIKEIGKIVSAEMKLQNRSKYFVVEESGANYKQLENVREAKSNYTIGTLLCVLDSLGLDLKVVKKENK